MLSRMSEEDDDDDDEEVVPPQAPAKRANGDRGSAR
jgi:hypothetical protein